MKLPDAFLQDADGNEETLSVTEPDPRDGTICIHLPQESDPAWIRVVPTVMMLCEIPRLILHADQWYVFRQDPDCPKCAAYLLNTVSKRKERS